MIKRNSLTEVPYQERWKYDGNQRISLGWHMTAYPEGYRGGVDWRPNEPLRRDLKLINLERGRSSARFWWRDSDGVEYPMFGQGLTEMLQAVKLDSGWVRGETWIAVKRGANYGIELYKGE